MNKSVKLFRTFSRLQICSFCNPAGNTRSFCSQSIDNRISEANGKPDVDKLAKPDVETKRLDIAVVGHPNAGKSTLVNSVCGKDVMPVSSKVHTTRASMRGYLTQGDTQLIFWDTPGLIDSKQARKHKLPKSIYDDPRRAFLHCDLIALMIDCEDHKNTNKIPPVVKEQLAKLFTTTSVFPDKEVVLILNKVDVYKGSIKSMKSLVQVLTEGIIGGKSIESRSTQAKPGKGLLAADFSTHLPNKLKRSHARSKINENSIDIENEFLTRESLEVENSSMLAFESEKKPQEKPSIVEVIDRDDDEYFQQLNVLKKRRGFNGFSAVFQISALRGFGLSELKSYFMGKAKPGKFEVKDGVYTNASVEKVIENAIISRVFENLPQHLPYKVNIEIQDVFETDHELVIVALLITPYQMGLILGENANTLRKIISESKELISTITQVPVKISLTVEERFYPQPRR